MITKLRNFLLDVMVRQKIAVALARGSAARQARVLDLARPSTWEFSGFSQNGEDGILEVLRGQLRSHNRYFVEIGTSDGTQNNTAWLVVAEQYDGLMIEGDANLAERARRTVLEYSIGAECRTMFVDRESGPGLRSLVFHLDPDVFSLDIDGNDYHVAQALFVEGFRPKIVVVEYNSAFGPKRSVTIEYRPDFECRACHPTHLYYGASIGAWRKFFAGLGYRFVTVESRGVNAFFVDPSHFDESFLGRIQVSEFEENRYQLVKFRCRHSGQFALIAGLPLVEV